VKQFPPFHEWQEQSNTRDRGLLVSGKLPVNLALGISHNKHWVWSESAQTALELANLWVHFTVMTNNLKLAGNNWADDQLPALFFQELFLLKEALVVWYLYMYLSELECQNISSQYRICSQNTIDEI
jgi:hypothetical protein